MANKTTGGIGTNQHQVKGRSIATDRSAAERAAALDVEVDVDWTPDDVDFNDAAESAVLLAGLGNFVHHTGAPYWDNIAAPADSIGLHGSIKLADVDTAYLPADIGGEIAALAGDNADRTLSYGMMRHDGLAREDAALISVTLTDDEQAAVAAVLREEGEMFTEDLVGFWSRGEPGAADRMFGFASPAAEWERVASAVRRAAPEAAQVRDVAVKLRLLAGEAFAAESQYIVSDDWKTDRAEVG